MLIVENRNLNFCSRQGLDNTTLTAEKKYAKKFYWATEEVCLSLHYIGVNSYLFVNGVKMYKFKVKDSEINTAPLCLGNIS